MTDADAAPELYALLDASEGARERLTAALAGGEIASVLILPPPGGLLDAAAARPLIETAQRQGVAALILDDAQLARTLRADGVHLGVSGDVAGAYLDARQVLGRDAIVGVDVGISRHDAMTVAEEGADYVAFGAPPHLKDRDKARLRRNDLIAWWAEIFETPCVALDVEKVEEAGALARAGADFLGVKLPAERVREFVGAIAAALEHPASAD